MSEESYFSIENQINIDTGIQTSRMDIHDRLVFAASSGARSFAWSLTKYRVGLTMSVEDNKSRCSFPGVINS